jgi:hypothetical protein
MAKKDNCSVNDQGPAPKITNTGLKNLAKTGSLYKNDGKPDTKFEAANQPPEHK